VDSSDESDKGETDFEKVLAKSHKPPPLLVKDSGKILPNINVTDKNGVKG